MNDYPTACIDCGLGEGESASCPVRACTHCHKQVCIHCQRDHDLNFFASGAQCYSADHQTVEAE